MQRYLYSGLWPMLAEFTEIESGKDDANRPQLQEALREWLGGQRVSEISFDRIAGSLADMFDFSRPVICRLLLEPATGLPVAPRQP